MQKKNISKLVTSYQDKTQSSNRKMAQDICDRLGIPDAISYNTIRNWKEELASPKNPALLHLLAQQDDGARSEEASPDKQRDDGCHKRHQIGGKSTVEHGRHGTSFSLTAPGKTAGRFCG